MKTKLTTIFKKSANTPPMWVCLLFALVISTNCWGDVTVTWGSYSGDNSLPSTPNVSAVNGLTLSSNMSVGDLVGHPTYRFTADNTQYVDISVGSDFFISNVETSILYDGGGDGRLYIQFCTSETYFDGNKKGDPIELLDLVSWGEWNTANPPLRSVSSVEENVKSARIYRVGANTYGTNLYRIRVSAVVDLSTKDDAELALTVTEKSIPVGGTFNIGVSTADGYDGEISYSVSPSGVVNLNESTGVVTGTAMGEATISVTASTTENYVGTTETCTVHVIKNFAGTLTASENGGNVTLEWFYNLPISLANDADPVKCGDNNEASYTSSTYANGVRTITYNTAGGTYYYCKDFKTSLNDAEVPNCKSFSFEYKGGGNNGTNARIVPYTWVHRPEWAAGDLVADPVSISSEWQEATVTPAYYWDQCGDDIKGNDLNDYSYYDYPVGCVAFCPMADDVVSGGTLQLRNAYFQIINTNGLTSSVKLVRKDGSAPADASDGTSIYTGAPTTYVDNSGLAAGHTYYYRLFVTYNDVEYASNAVSITMPGVAKKDPELSLPASSTILKIGDTYTLEPTVASGYDGTLAYEITAGSDKISLSGSTITAEAAGTATVRVTAPETTEYNQVTANFTVTVLAAPETNLALDASGDDIELSWNIPGIIDLRSAKTTPSIDSYGNCTSKELSISNNNEELTVTYSAVSGWTDNAFSFDVNISNIESLSFEYHGDYTGSVWSGIYPVLYCQNNTSSYWDSNKGTHGLSATEWTSKGASEFVLRGSGSAFDASQTYTEILFVASDEGEVSNGHMYLRNVRYHTTGMVDIDHIVIMRTTNAAATDTLSGTKLYSGRMFHYTDNAALSSGTYYYTLFAVYANGCIPVESVSMDNRTFNITYKDKGDAEFSGTHETGYPTTHSNAAATALKKATKENYAFVGWYDNAACTGDAVTSLAAGAYDADITLYARWEQLSLHQPGKYQTPTSEGGYGRILKSNNGHDYEVYMVTYDTIETEHYGALYAGPVAKISDGYRMFRMEKKWDTKESIKGDGWVEFNAYKYEGSESSCNINEFQQLNKNSGIYSSQYARLKSTDYVQMYVQGYTEFAFIGNDYNATGDNFIVRIDGKEATPSYPNPYEANTSAHVTRYALTPANEPHFIEITGSSSNTNKFRGFSLQLPDVEHYTVTVAKNENAYGTVSAASIANVRTGEATYVSDNTLYIAGTTVTATPAENTAEYTYAFDSWSGVPATITEATTVTANFTRTGNDYTLTWDLNGGTVTTAGTGAAVNASGTPSSSVAYGTAITAPIVAKDGYAFIGWDVTPTTMPAANITYTAQWALFHQPGKYVTEEGEGGYGQDLKFNNHRYYEVYRFAKVDDKGALYAGSKSTVTDGFAIISNAENNAESKDNDGWVVVKPYDYTLSGGTYNIGAEFMTIKSYTRFSSSHHLRLYIQGYDEFAFAARDNGTSEQLVVRINGVEQSYEQSTSDHISNRYSLDENTPYVIEITSNSTNHNCRILGFSLRIPGVEQYTVTMASSNNSYGTVDVANVSPVPSGSTISIADNVLTLNETNVTATPTTATAEYTYAFNGWSVSNGASITEDQTITANFTRTTNSYTLTWNLDGGTVTEAGTGVDVNATGTPSSSVVYGTAITVPTVTKAGSDFLGWDVTPAATMPAEDVTYTAKWYAPVVIPSGTTHLDANNYYPYTTAAKAPTKSTFNVDGEGAAETCLDISDNHYAEWQAKIAQGYYQVTMLYGTTGYAVNVNLKVIDPSTNPETVICTTTTDIHSDGSGNHCCYQAKWGVDLRGIDDDPDKLYIIRVEDVYNGTGSHPQIGYVEFEPATPTTLSGTAPTYLNHNNVTTAYRITPFDIEDNGSNETCLFIGDNNKADWLVKIAPITYNIRVRYGRTTGTRLTLYIIDGSNHVVWNSDTRPTPSGRYEVWEINGIDLSDKVNATDEYIIRIKDDYDGAGSYPYIEYIEFIPKVTHTRTGLTVGNYGTICLPYAVAAEDIHGADIFDMQGWPAGSVAVVLNEVDNMEAGRPYVFQAKATTATWSYYPEGDPAAAGSHNGLIGSYDKEVIPANANNYIVYDNKLYFVDVLAYVGINKAYINRTLAEEAQEPVAPAPGKRQIRLFLNGEQVATDIDQINNNQSPMTNKIIKDNQLFILRDGKLYNAQGKLIK